MNLRWQVLFLIAFAAGTSAGYGAVSAVEKQAPGVLIRFESGSLRLEVRSGQVVWVTCAPGASILSTRALHVEVSKSTGAVTYVVEEIRVKLP